MGDLGLNNLTTYRIVFVREEGLKGITAHGICMFRARDGHNGLTLLRDAIQAWCRNTEEGKKLYDYSAGDLNIGDLAGSIESDALLPYGIEALFIAVNEDMVIPYDTHLCLEDPHDEADAESP